MAQRVVLDACVLAPFPLFDTLLRLADSGIVTVFWSPLILAEVERTLVRDLGRTEPEARKRISQMQKAFPDASVEPHDDLIAQMRNHPKDRHVLAAAVEAGADTIVTANLADFPETALTGLGITAIHPDQFLTSYLSANPDVVISILRAQRSSYANPAFTLTEFYATFQSTVPEFARQALALDDGGPEDGRPVVPQVGATEMPLPLEQRSSEEILQAVFPDGEPDPSTPLGSAMLWWKALLDRQHLGAALRDLTYDPSAWGDFADVAESLDGWCLASGVHPYAEAPDEAAVVKFIPEVAGGGQLFADALIQRAHFLVLVRCEDGWWRAWGICENRIPAWVEIVPTSGPGSGHPRGRGWKNG